MMKKPEEKRASSNELLTFSDDELGEMYLAAGFEKHEPVMCRGENSND